MTRWLGISLMAISLFAALFCASCDNDSGGGAKIAAPAEDPNQITSGTIEVTARLVEVPEGAIFERPLYNFATVLKYQAIETHRGQATSGTIYVGHYNPWKPRAKAADEQVPNVGGTVRQFQAGQIHRMGLEAPIDDHFMGGIVNKYFGQTSDPIYWAVVTNEGE